MKHTEVEPGIRVYVNHLNEPAEGIEKMRRAVSLQAAQAQDTLELRAAGATGTVQGWVKGALRSTVWIKQDRTDGKLVPYFIAELAVVKNCICRSMTERLSIESRQPWQCPYHGRVANGTVNIGTCMEHERDGRIIQVEAA
jgi:hypothetical protein